MSQRTGLAVRARAALLSVAAGLAALSVLGPAAPASAHANLLFTSPAASSTVALMPETVTLFFDESVTIEATPVSLEGPVGTVQPGAAALAGDGSTVEVRIPGEQPQGVYEVNWRVAGEDGEVMAGSFPFAVGPAAVGVTEDLSGDAKGTAETGILRGLLLAALALSLGEGAGRWLLGRIPNARPHGRSWLPVTTAVGMSAAIGLVLLVVGRGSLLGSISDPDLGALASRAGAVALGEAMGFGLALSAALWRRPGWSVVPLGVIVAAEAVRAHPAVVNPLVGIPLTVVHLGGAMLWTGTLIYVVRTVVAWRREPALAGAAISAYARPAVWLFAAVVVTGLGTALLLLSPNQMLSTPYGQVLLVKVAMVTLAAGLAWTARRRLQRNRSLRSTSGAARVEAIALIGVVALSAALTVLPPPADPNAPLPFAPPPTGPVVPAATLTGYVQLKAEASAGQLVVQLEAPEVYDDAGEVIPLTPTLAGAIASPSGEVSELAFRSCGDGCFFAPMTWEEGSSSLTLSPTVGELATAETGLMVDWPPLPADDLLAEVIAAMNAVPSMVLHERVTGDPATGLGQLSSFPTSGPEYVQRALFSSGRVPAMVRLPDVDGNRRIAMSFPTESAVDVLTIAPDGRILAETLTGSNLVTKTFVYPE